MNGLSIQVILFCNFLPPLFLLLFVLSKKVGNRRTFSACFSLSTVAACGGFLYLQTVLNTPDVGMEVQQFYLPLLVYLCCFLLGAFLFFRTKKPDQ